MTNPTVPTDPAASDRDAYMKAQKQRNLYIGLGLAVFVVLVFFISMARMAQGLHKDAAKRADTASVTSAAK